MSDAYAEWLDIPPHLRPPTYYQLLGIAPSELDPAAINAAADRQLARLRPHAAGPRADESRRIETEVLQARDTLLDPVARLRYDTMTPDAADPWWKPDQAPVVPPDQVEGWWQGEAPQADAAAKAPARAATVPPPLPAKPPAPAAPKPDDWWKAGAAPPAPPPLPALRPSPPAAAPVASPPPLPRPAPAQTAPPLLPEPQLAYEVTRGRGSRLPWVLLAVVAIGAAGAGMLLLTRPWAKNDPPTDPNPVAENKTQPETPPVKPAPKEEPPLPPTPKPKDPDEPRPPAKVGNPPKPKDPPAPVEPSAKDPKTSPEAVEPVTFRVHKGSAYGVAVSRSGDTILSISDDRNVLRYAPREPGKHTQVHRLGSPGVAVVLCNNDRDAAFCDGGEAVIYDLATGRVRATFENPRGGIRCLAAAPDGSFLLTGTTDGAVRWWSVPKKALADTLDVDDKATVTAVAISADAKSAALGLSDGRVCVWDLRTRKETKRWKAHAGAVTAVAHAPDGRRFVSTGEDGVANVWQPTGQLVQKLTGHAGPVLAVGWCSDGKRVVTAGLDKQVRLWDQDKGWKVAWSNTLPDRASSVAVDARDRFVVVGLAGGAVQVIPLGAR